MGYLHYAIGKTQKTKQAIALGKLYLSDLEGYEFESKDQLKAFVISLEPFAEDVEDYASRVASLIVNWIDEPILILRETEYPCKFPDLVVAASVYDNDEDVGRRLGDLIHEG